MLVYLNSRGATSETSCGIFATVNSKKLQSWDFRVGLAFAEIRRWPEVALGDDHVLQRRLQMGPSPDAGLDHHVYRAANHDEVLNVVAPDEDELAALID